MRRCLRDLTFSCSSVEHRLVTDRLTDGHTITACRTAYTALAWRRAVKKIHCLTPARLRHTSLHVKSPTSTKIPAVDADCGRRLTSRLSIQCSSHFYWETCPDCQRLVLRNFLCRKRPESLIAVVESEIRVADFRQVAPLYIWLFCLLVFDKVKRC